MAHDDPAQDSAWAEERCDRLRRFGERLERLGRQLQEDSRGAGRSMAEVRALFDSMTIEMSNLLQEGQQCGKDDPAEV